MKNLRFVFVTMLVLFLCVGVSFAGDIDIKNKSKSKSEAVSGSYIEDNSVYNNRQFVSPGNVPMPGTNGFFTNPTPDSSFRSIKDILRAFNGQGTYCMVVSRSALKNWAKGGDVDTNYQIMRGHDQVTRIYGDDYEGTELLYIAIEEPIFGENAKGETVLKGTVRPEGLVTTAMVDGEADDSDTNSLQVIGKVGLKALDDGNNYMVITAEGAHRMVVADGWGIGFYTTGATVSESGKQSGLAGGGTGYAYNESGPEDKPWIQGYVAVGPEK